MKHARKDYAEIQDPTGKIPQDEPVFLLRGQDQCAADTVDFWADAVEDQGGSEKIVRAAREQAMAMRVWQKDRASKIPDMP